MDTLSVPKVHIYQIEKRLNHQGDYVEK